MQPARAGTAPTLPRTPRADGYASAEEHRTLMSMFPSGVSVVTTTGADGTPYGMTCSSLCSVTLEPPTLLVCLNTRGRTLPAIRARRYFGVNLLHSRARPAAELFARTGLDRFAAVHWEPSPHAGLPWLSADAFALAECRVAAVRVVGSHAVVYGQVVAVDLADDTPLLYGLRRFAGWPAG
ncbi:MAG TPA: flavin reductase family protein [Rugosimonospora sp.]|nr:flavin reductase family protein [Rugosimonospora sp.]